MDNVIVETLAMMGLTFVIGMAVAYLINVMVFAASFLEPNGYQNFKSEMARRKEEKRSEKERIDNVIDEEAQKSDNEIMRHFYSKSKNKKKSNYSDNEIISHFYGKD
jgi:predicted RND superfamily exporter protein